jgi:hypothetical protein
MARVRFVLKRRDIAVAIAALIVTALLGGAIRIFEESQQLPARSYIEGSLYAAEPGERGGAEARELARRDAFWNHRYTYPTGKADRKWLEEAARQDQEKVRSGIPAGRVTYSRENNDAPLALNPNQWISIGPQPQDSNTCEVCFPFGIVAGRVNDVVVDPVTQTIAYLASDGGGVWKTTNCCSAATTWAPATDSPLISTVAIGDLALDPTNHYVYAGTGDLRFGSFSFGSAGLLKSTDFGATWQVKGADVFRMPLPQPPGIFPQYDSIGKVAVDPRNSNNLIVGTKRGVFFSYNGGDNWTGPCLPDPFPNQRQDITAVQTISSTNVTELFVAVGSRGYSTTVQYNLAENGANGIYTTTVPLSGCPATWSLVSRPNNGWPPGSGSGVPQYQPGGNVLGRIDLAVAPSNPNYIYAEVSAIKPGFGAIQTGGLLGVWRSTDRGATWQQRVTAQDLEDAQDECGGNCVGGDPLGVCGDIAQNWYDQHIAVDPNDPNVIFFDNVDVWKSTDGGDTIRDVTCGYSTIQVPRPVHVDQHAITFLPGSSTRALFGNDGGIYLSESVNLTQPTFIQLNNSLSTIEFYGGDISANFATSPAPFAVAGAQDNGSSSWQAADPSIGPYLWQQRIGGDGMFARIEPVLGQRVYMEAQVGAMRLSTSGHQGPYPLLSAETNYTLDEPRLSFVFPYEIYKGVPAGAGGGEECPPTGCTHLIGGTFRVWENTGGALPENFWYVNSPDLTKNTLADRSFINQLAYAPRTDDIAIAGTNDGNVWIGFGLGNGAQNPASWANVTGGNAVLPNRPVLDVALDGAVMITTTMPVGYAAVGGFDENTPGTPGHVFKITCTAANCTSFTVENKSGNLPNVPADSIVGNPKFRQQVFVGTDWGVYYTNNIDAATPEWFRFNAGMPNVMVWDFAIDRGFTTLAAFTRSRGVFVWPLPSAPFVGPTPTGTITTVTPTSTLGPPNTPVVAATYTVNPSITASPTRTATSAPPTITPGGPSLTPTPTTGAEIVLYDQYNRQSAALGTGSQRYNGNPNDSRNLELADDFVVPGGQQWIVTSVAVDGFYSGTGPNAGSVNVAFYTNSVTGTLPGPLVVSMTVVHQDAGGPFRIPLSPAVNLNAGTYWVSVQPNLIDTRTWAWYNRRPPQAHNPAALRRPNSTAINNACRDWQPRIVCIAGSQAEPDQVFLLNGYLIGGGTATTTALATGTPVATVVTGTATLVASTATTTVPAATTTGTPALPTGTVVVATSTRTNVATVIPGTGTATPGVPTLTATIGAPTQTIIAQTGTPIASTTTVVATQTPIAPTTTLTPAAPTSTRTVVATLTPVSTTNTVVVSTATRTITPILPTGTSTVVLPSSTTTSLSTVTRTPTTVAGTGTSTRTPTAVSTATRTGTAAVLSPTSTVAQPTTTVTQPTGTVAQPSATVAQPTRTLTPVPPTACPVQFIDVPQSNTFYQYVRCLACRGIIGGYNDGTFRPNNDITRGQIAKIVSQSAGFSDPAGRQIYEDVPEASPFFTWIQRLSNRGLVGGYPCGLVPEEPCIPPANRPYFRPNASATRGQLSKIVASAAGITTTPTGETYQDVPTTHTFYVWIEQLSNLGVMGGYPCGTMPSEPCGTSNKPYFRPNNNVTRGQASKIVANTFFPGCQTSSRP